MEVMISVRGLVEFILRNGDIDNRKAASPEGAMQEGSRIHRMLQKRMGADYHAEVSLQYVYATPRYDIIVEGRADGIIDGQLAKRILQTVPPRFERKEQAALLPEEIPQNQYPDILGDTVVIDEIKGTYKDVGKMKEPDLVHLAQAKCYAYIYAKHNNLPFIRVRMTYCHLETEELQYFFRDYRIEELEEWFEDLMRSYRKWADYEVEWKEQRQRSIRELAFPFAYREGQKELITYVYRTLYHKKKLFIEAPTGAGKTLSSVYPSVKAVGEQMAEKIFYLTAKTITRTVAEEAFSILRDNGLLFKTVILTARDKICFLEETECNPVACPYAKGHYDRVNDAVYDMLTHEVSFTRELVEAYAKKHQVCPFEMCLDISLFADGVICDYNYVFDPHVYLRRFFAEGVRRDYIFLVDEAHNLVDRGREMYSAVLVKEDFLECKKAVKTYDKKMASLLERCNRQLLLYKKECGSCLIMDSIESFILALNKLASQMEKFLEEHDDSPVRKAVLEFYFEISHFLLIYDKLNDKYVIYSEMQKDGSFMLKLFCVDPSGNLEECMMRGRSSILFSATLLPIQYYKGLLGGGEEDYEVYASSVFSPEKRGMFIGSDITSKYTRRGPGEYYRAASYIKEITAAKKGNYLIFFPSHAFLKQVYERYQETFYDEESETCIVQEEYMGEKEREEFLKQFSLTTEGGRSLLGFCVLGGIFSEGIDLRNDRLIGAVIVGTGLPQVCSEREIIRQYFEECSGNGFDYAYQYPGMNKVLQAAGRVIRTVDDIGIVALLDERFLQRSYQRMFPREWENYQVTTCSHAAFHVGEFWKKWEL